MTDEEREHWYALAVDARKRVTRVHRLRRFHFSFAISGCYVGVPAREFDRMVRSGHIKANGDVVGGQAS